MTFDDFWALYPRHEAKKDAKKAFDRVPFEAHELISAALTWQVHRDDWLKDDGHYIPLPASWLRGERWEDERRSGSERRQHARSEYHVWAERGCPHQPRCAHFIACQLRSQKAS